MGTGRRVGTLWRRPPVEASGAAPQEYQGENAKAAVVTVPGDAEGLPGGRPAPGEARCC